MTLPSFPSTSFSSSFGTGLFSYPLPFAGQLRHSQLPGFLFAIGLIVEAGLAAEGQGGVAELVSDGVDGD